MDKGLLIHSIYTGYDTADVLQNVSLHVQPGTITCLLGSNGSGKTTLIRSILGLTPPRVGRIIFNGKELCGMPTHQIVASGISCIPEGRRVFGKLTVAENLEIGAYREKVKARLARQREFVYEIFPRLSERRYQLAGTLSGGEQAMVSIGRALMGAPQLLLIDEPSLGLSPRLVSENYDLMKQINERGITIFLVEQNVHQTLEISDYGYVLCKGQVVAEGDRNYLSENKEMRSAYFGRTNVD